MLKLEIKDKFIKLGQAMKLADLVDSGDIFEFDGAQVQIVAQEV